MMGVEMDLKAYYSPDILNQGTGFFCKVNRCGVDTLDAHPVALLTVRKGLLYGVRVIRQTIQGNEGPRD